MRGSGSSDDEGPATDEARKVAAYQYNKHVPGNVAWRDVQHGDVFELPLDAGEGFVRLTALHTPGHSEDHVCFLLDACAAAGDGDSGNGGTSGPAVVSERALFAGDNVLG
jgi:glyoxylase-like metal-dependent hydrolase (beta-lactamase superfamily II)